MSELKLLSLVNAMVSLFAMTLGSLACAAEPRAGADDPAWRQSVEKVVEEYIRDRPEVIEQARYPSVMTGSRMEFRLS